MGERISIIKLLALPETFAVVLLTFSFVLVLAPYFSGADFGLFKIPQFTDHARQKLKVFGPIIFLALVVLFVPIIPVSAPAASSNANQSDTGDKRSDSNHALTNGNSNPAPATPTDVHSQALQHIGRAKALYEQTQYEEALKECDKALDLEPENQDALGLKTSISRTVEILNWNQ